MAFQQAREIRAERLLKDTELCDAFAVLGSEQQRVPCHRALLANVSEPFRKAFFGDFKESTNKEVALPEVTLDAFGCIARAAVNLDPNLNADNVVQTLRAASMYMVKDLVDECEHYMKTQVTSETALTIMTACLTSSFALPENLEDVEATYWAMLFEESKRALKSPSFVHAHGDIIVRLLKRDEFLVDEETLWSRLVEWVQNAKDRPQLWGSIADDFPAEPDPKRPKVEPGATSDGEQTSRILLQHLAKHVRLPTMKREFFIDNVRRYLTREDSEDIMTYFLIPSRPLTTFSKAKRTGLKLPEEWFPINASSSHQPNQAARLPQGDASWTYPVRFESTECGLGIKKRFECLKVESAEPFTLTKVRLTFAAEGKPWEFKVSTALQDPVQGKHEIDGRMMTWNSTPWPLSSKAEQQWRITPDDSCRDRPATNLAALVKIECFGKKSLKAHSLDIANKLSEELNLLRIPAPKG